MQNNTDDKNKKDNTIEIPVHIINEIIKVYTASENLNKNLGREPTDDEIAKNLSWPIKRVLGVKGVAAQIMNATKYTGSVLDLLSKSHKPSNEIKQ